MPFLFQRFPKTTSDSFLIRVSKGHNSFATSFFLLNELLLKRAAGRRNRQEMDINATKKKTQILVRKNKILYYLQRSWKESEQQANLVVYFITMQSASFPAWFISALPQDHLLVPYRRQLEWYYRQFQCLCEVGSFRTRRKSELISTTVVLAS